MDFKVGDDVLCIDDNCSRLLTVGRVYTIVVMDKTALQLLGLEGRWYVVGRFIKQVEEKVATNEQV